MSAEPEPWLLLYTLSGFVVLLLAISTLFSLGEYLLRPWFDRQESLLHALPPDQYLSFFAFPFLATILAGIINIGTGSLGPDRPKSIQGIALLAIAFFATLWAGLLAVRQLIRARRNDPINLARSDKPASMRFALAELVRSVNTLMADAPILDIRRAHFDSKRLRKIHDELNMLVDERRQQEPVKSLVTRSRELAAGYTRLVTLATLAAAMLAIVATVVQIVAGGGVLRAASLGAFLVLLAAGLWWAGMWLRAKTHANRYAALKKQLTIGLDQVRSRLDGIDQLIPNEGRQVEVTKIEVARARRLFSDELDVLLEQLRQAVSQMADLSSESLRASHSTNPESSDSDTLVPVSIFLSGSRNTDLEAAVHEAAGAFGFEVAAQERARTGSWYRQLWLRTQEVARSESVRERAQKLEQAIELEVLGKRRAQVDKAKADAIAMLITAIDCQESAVIRVGSIVVVKRGQDLAAFTISELEAAHLERSPTAYIGADSFLSELQRLRNQQAASNPSTEQSIPEAIPDDSDNSNRDV